MEYVDNVIRQIIDNFDFGFVFIVNVLAYVIIKLITDVLAKRPILKKFCTWHKRFILIACIAIVAIIYHIAGYDDKIRLVNSGIITPVFWDFILRPIFVKFGIDYKKIDDTMN